MREFGFRKRRLRVESLETRRLLAGDVLQNPADPYDVNDDARVSAQDALIVVNSIARETFTQPEAELGLGSQSAKQYYLDVSGDGAVTAHDALHVINALAEPEEQSEHDFAVDDGPFVFAEDSEAQTIDVLANDQITDGFVSRITHVLGREINVGSSIIFGGATVTNNGDSLTFEASENFSGEVRFSYTADNVITTDEGDNVIVTDMAMVEINVTPVDDPPMNRTRTELTIDEDEDCRTCNRIGLSVLDADPEDVTTRVVLELLEGLGSISVDHPSLVTFDDGQRMVLEGPLSEFFSRAQFTSIRISYTPDVNVSGSDELRITTTTDVGGAGELTDVDTVAITIEPVNDLPVIRVPQPQDLFDTQLLRFSDEDIIQVSDVDASELEVTLHVDSGARATLHIGQVPASVEVDGNSTGTVQLRGPIAGLNAALDGLVYEPVPGFAGNDKLTITADDGEDTVTETVAIAVRPIGSTFPLAIDDHVVIAEDTASIDIFAVANDLRDPVLAESLNITGQSLFPDSIFVTPRLALPIVGGGGILDGSQFAITDEAGKRVVFEFNAEFTELFNPDSQEVPFNTFDTILTVNESLVNSINTSGLKLTASVDERSFAVVLNRPAIVELLDRDGTFRINMRVQAAVARGDTFAISDGVTPVTFVFDDGLAEIDACSFCRIPLDTSFDGDSPESLAESIVEAIANVPGLMPRSLGNGRIGIDPNSVFQFNIADTQLGLTSTTERGGTLTLHSNVFSYVPVPDFVGRDTFEYTIESAPDPGTGPSRATVAIDVTSITDPPISLDIVGRVFVAGSGDSASDHGSIDGVVVVLRGTGHGGDPLTLRTRTDGHGNYRFNNVLLDRASASTATITPVFGALLVNEDAYRVRVDPTDGDETVRVDIAIDLREFKPQFASVFDLFGQSQGRSGIDIGIVDQSQQFARFVGDGWDTSRYSHARLELFADGLSGVLKVFDSQSGRDRMANVAVSDGTLTYRGHGENRLYRVIGDASLLEPV